MLQWLMDDVVHIRAVNICACIMYILYNYGAPATPLWLLMRWDALFILINSVQVFRILQDRSSVELSWWEQLAFDNTFRGALAPMAVRRVLAEGKRETAAEGQPVVTRSSTVCLIIKGDVQLTVEGKEVATLSDGDFLGEMEYLSDKDEPSVDKTRTTALTQVEFIVWDNEDLRNFLGCESEVDKAMRSIWNLQLANRLEHMDTLLRRSQIVEALRSYKFVLMGIVAEDKISRDECLFLTQYRLKNGITDEQHLKVLNEIGWSKELWDRSCKGACKEAAKAAKDAKDAITREVNEEAANDSSSSSSSSEGDDLDITVKRDRLVTRSELNNKLETRSLSIGLADAPIAKEAVPAEKVPLKIILKSVEGAAVFESGPASPSGKEEPANAVQLAGEIMPSDGVASNNEGGARVKSDVTEESISGHANGLVGEDDLSELAKLASSDKVSAEQFYNDLIAKKENNEAKIQEALEASDQYMKEAEKVAGGIAGVIHRVNAGHAEDAHWTIPKLHSVEKWVTAERREFKHYEDMAKLLIKQGRVAVHIIASGAAIHLDSHGMSEPVWTAMPYKLAGQSLGEEVAEKLMETKGKMAVLHKESFTSTFDGLSLGSRQIMAVVAALKNHGGPDALKKTMILIHIGSDLEMRLISDLVAHKFYGMPCENILILQQPMMPGFKFDTENASFVEDKSSPLRYYGTGYAMQQLMWPEEVLQLEANGKKTLLKEDLLSILTKAKVEWLVSNRVNDLNTLDPNRAIDLRQLARTLSMHMNFGSQMSLQVLHRNNLGEGDADGFDVPSVVLASAERGHPLGSAPDHQFVSELNYESCKSFAMFQLIEELKTQKPLATGCDRYIFNLKGLRNTLNTSAFHPTLYLEEWEDDIKGADQKAMGGFGESLAIYPFMDMADITLQPRMRCVGLLSEVDFNTTSGSTDGILRMLDAVYQQDCAKDFVKEAKKLASKGEVVQRSMNAVVRFRVVVYCNEDTKNASFSACKQMLLFMRPGLDALHLVHIVYNGSKTKSAMKLLMKFEPKDLGLDCIKEVLVKPDHKTLAEYMVLTATKLNADLVVMGSERLAVDSSGMGSLALSVAKSIERPIFIHKSTDYFTSDMIKQGSWLIGCDVNSKHVLEYASKIVRQPDTAILTRVIEEDTYQEAEEGKRILNYASQLAMSSGIRSTTFTEEGKVTEALVKAARQKKAMCMVVDAPTKDGLSDSMKSLISFSPCSVLIFKKIPSWREREAL
ncbi:hypothetical protein CYMTET_19115 [Cymbomonas tetramitiformis]|uniref:Cyclic nucleotide-binding domain-containing protein n=1 Tax=Cymbomonas tetramitiformis TaxID=36881 RepID=A0AAE0L5M5_9CHLO|nr:hypothetical protein CYMTET_19115 [Cymbomonas tetramitiformis]